MTHPLFTQDPVAIGEAIFNTTISEYSGNFEEIGEDLISLQQEFSHPAQLYLIERVLIAITGSGFDSLNAQIDADMESGE